MTEQMAPASSAPAAAPAAARELQHFTLRAPRFTASSDAWKVSQRGDSTRLRVARGGAIPGNLVWADLPAPLVKGSTYRLRIEWTPQTDVKTVNLHFRNAASGRFRVIGHVEIPSGSTQARTDTVVFKAPESDLSQFMLGALHFSGRRGGAEVRLLDVEEVPAGSAQLTGGAPAGGFAEQARTLALEDFNRQSRSFKHARSSSDEGIPGARARMIFHAHAIEKGLSRSNLRPGFGKVAIPGLAKEMNAWLAAGRPVEDAFVQSSAAVMKSYFDRNARLNADVSHFRQLFSEQSQDLIDTCTHQEGGVLPADQLREITLETDESRSFIDVVYGRRSIREFTSEPVSDDDIRRAVQIAMQAPSVCNRQGPRVHQFEDPRIIKQVLDIQGGFSGYEMPPKLLLITADLDAFLFAPERNQPFVDGGLFMMGLLLGLTQVGLGSCSLNTAMGTQKENAIRKIIDIPDNEVFICFVAVGHYDQKVLVPRSKRTDVTDILRRHTKG